MPNLGKLCSEAVAQVLYIASIPRVILFHTTAIAICMCGCALTIPITAKVNPSYRPVPIGFSRYVSDLYQRRAAHLRTMHIDLKGRGLEASLTAVILVVKLEWHECTCNSFSSRAQQIMLLFLSKNQSQKRQEGS